MAIPSGACSCRGLFAAAIWLALAGCAATITPPRDVTAPTAVLLLDHGRHTSLVLPAGTGLVRYAYGDWAWYAERRTGAIDALRALFGSSRAGLGRKRLQPPPEPAAVRGQLSVGVERILVLQVEAARAEALVEGLDAVFRRSDQHHYNRAYDLEFAAHPEPYRLGHNSNHVVAAWLRALGCEVSGPLVLANWRLAPEAAP